MESVNFRAESNLEIVPSNPFLGKRPKWDLQGHPADVDLERGQGVGLPAKCWPVQLAVSSQPTHLPTGHHGVLHSLACGRLFLSSHVTQVI